MVLVQTVLILLLVTLSTSNGNYGWHHGWHHQQNQVPVTGNYKCVPVGTCPGGNVSSNLIWTLEFFLLNTKSQSIFLKAFFVSLTFNCL